MKKIISIFLIAFTLSSCNDFLDKEPQSDYASSNFYNSTEAIKQGSNGVYQSLYMDTNNLPFCTLYDMYTPMGIERADNASIGVGNVNLLTNYVIETQWSKFYIGIARANAVLEGAEPYFNNLDDEAKAYLAEIRVIRAFHYHYLVSLFGDVPYFKKSVTLEEQKAAVRTPWKEIVDDMIVDLDEASVYLPWQAKQMGRIDRTFAQGLKARMALYAGSWSKEGFGKKGDKDLVSAEKYFRVAADATNKIQMEAGRSLNPNFAELFTREGQMGGASQKENVFALMYSDQGDTKTHYMSFGEQSRMFAQSGRFPTQLLVDTYEMANGKRIDEAGSGYDPKKPFASRDPRLKQTVYVHHDTIIGNSGGKKMKFLVELFNAKTKSFDVDGNETLVDNLDHTGSVAQYGYIQSGVGYLWKKYNHFNDETVALASYNVLLMRYAELLLIYAEAKIELGEIDHTVYAAIDEVRNRSKMPSVLEADPTRSGNQDKMRQVVRRERKVELAREAGLHFFDMRRWRTGALENAERTYGFPVAGYDKVTSDMVPTYGGTGTQRDLNDLALYSEFGAKLRSRDADRPKNWDDKFYLWPVPQTERNKAPWLTQNDGYED